MQFKDLNPGDVFTHRNDPEDTRFLVLHSSKGYNAVNLGTLYTAKVVATEEVEHIGHIAIAHTQKIKCFNIKWDTDTDSEEELEDVPPPELPEEYILDVDLDVDMDFEGADVLSDLFGFCVFSFEWEKVK